jgi:hypothetical protein
VALSLAISIKLMPAVFGLFLLIQKQWKLLLVVFFATLFFLLAPAALLTDINDYIYYWQDFLLKKNASQPRVTASDTHFSVGHLILALNGGQMLPKVYFTLGKLCVVLAAAVSLIYLKRKKCSKAMAASASILLLIILFLSPMSQTHYLIFTAPAFWLGIDLLQKSKILELWERNKTFIFSFSAFIVLFILGGLYHEPHQQFYIFSFISLWISLMFLDFSKAKDVKN